MAEHSREPGSEARIRAWLNEHPDFFVRNAELLERMELPHGADAASLLEHQARRLREENARLKTQLRHLSGIAGENERLMQRLHRLTLELMEADDLSLFLRRLFGRLAEDFQADRVRLALLEPDIELPACDELMLLSADLPSWMARLLEGGRPDCGRLTRAKLELLFGKETAGEVASAALVPIPGRGVLAIGARSPERFYPDMGTLFLELLGNTVGFRLDSLGGRRRKRA